MSVTKVFLIPICSFICKLFAKSLSIFKNTFPLALFDLFYIVFLTCTGTQVAKYETLCFWNDNHDSFHWCAIFIWWVLKSFYPLIVEPALNVTPKVIIFSSNRFTSGLHFFFLFSSKTKGSPFAFIFFSTVFPLKCSKFLLADIFWNIKYQSYLVLNHHLREVNLSYPMMRNARLTRNTNHQDKGGKNLVVEQKEPYFLYHEILCKNLCSTSKTR